jgi:hypothetical protein
MTYTVWLLTRPLSYASSFSPLALVSDGKDHFQHWGVLVSEMSLINAQEIMSHVHEYVVSSDIHLGTLYVSFRGPNDYNNVNIIRGFGLATIAQEWPSLTAQFVGDTEMTQEMIDDEGI